MRDKAFFFVLTHERGGFFNGSSSTGIFNFTGIYSGNSFAEFLLGIPQSVTRDYYKTLNGDFGYYMNWYIQDNYRVSDRLTLNLGFRLERNTFYQGIDREGILLEFHAEAFNLLNHPSFNAPSTNIDSGSGGQVSSTINSSRELQFALKIHF